MGASARRLSVSDRIRITVWCPTRELRDAFWWGWDYIAHETLAVTATVHAHYPWVGCNGNCRSGC